MTPQVRLRDVSIQIDSPDGLIAVWTVGKKGDVLYRHGVTRDCPQVNKKGSNRVRLMSCRTGFASHWFLVAFLLSLELEHFRVSEALEIQLFPRGGGGGTVISNI